jgi:Sec-independent protein translocase protein TatA
MNQFKASGGSWNCQWAQWLCVAAALFVIIGCSSEPVIAKGNVKLIGKLKTAIGAKQTDWLEATAKQIDDAHQQGKVSDGEYAALEPIVADGRQKHWDDANSGLDRLIKAQSP